MEEFGRLVLTLAQRASSKSQKVISYRPKCAWEKKWKLCYQLGFLYSYVVFFSR